ncbi:hypothetical protein V5O48_001347 [Marasmius crinis-equi]|uniref:Uncharacterized protein n=1 Tax=Marasmius crinis-equi TaxID=585013 RepID=A0ABR3FYX8_9AGAR
MSPAGVVPVQMVCSGVNSARSDVSAFSYSPPVSEASRFCLEEGYPSIITTVEHLRRSCYSRNITAIRGLAQVFSNCLTSIIASMDSLPDEVRTFPDYELAQYGAVFTNGLLCAHAKDLGRNDAATVLEIMEMSFSNLKYFLEVAGKVYSDHEFSPIPQYFIVDKSSPMQEDEAVAETTITTPEIPQLDAATEQPRIHLSDVVDGVDERISPRSSSESTPNSPQSSIIELPTVSSETTTLIDTASIDHQSLDLPSERPKVKTSIIQRALRLRPSFASLLSSTRFRSTTTLVASVNESEEGPDGTKKNDIEDYMRRHKALPDIPYTLRQSAVYFLPDPLHPEVDVEMPLPSGETVEIRLSPQGEYKGATLTALIRLITSKDVIKNPRTAQLFYFGLGYFICPSDAVAKLTERFNEQSPPGLNAAQLRVWTREAAAVRIRVGHVVAMWLEQYWDFEVCGETVITALQDFIFDDLLDNIPHSLSSKIVLRLEAVINGRSSRKAWRADLIKLMSEGVSVLGPTGFEVASSERDRLDFGLCQLDTPLGREELARVLTGVLFDMHGAVDPGSAVRCWFFGDHDSQVYSKLQKIVHWERSLYLWVTSTVLVGENKEDRASVIQFLVDVASSCLSLRNFSCASIIHGALVSPPVYRLKETLLAVDVEHKIQFRVLSDHFSGFDNYGKYRQAIDELKDHKSNGFPYIPILAPLIRDIEVIKTASPTIPGRSPHCSESKLLNLAAAGVIQYAVSVLENSRLPYKFERTSFLSEWLNEELTRYPPEKEQTINDELDRLSATCEAKRPGFEQINGWSSMRAKGSIVDLGSPNTVEERKPGLFKRLAKKV